jgi:hypothetical protein
VAAEHSQENSQKVFFSLGYRISQWAENRFYLFWGHLSQKQSLLTDPGRNVIKPETDRS